MFFRNLLFTILQPGIVAGLVPYLLYKGNAGELCSRNLSAWQWMGLLLFLIGLVIMFHCIVSFALDGLGTISPVDPTKKLVVSGFYKYSRNPMYIGVMLILAGESILFRSAEIGRYAFSVFIAFNLFIMLIEEPRLKKDFGDEYEAYRKRVRRWI